MSTNNRYHRQIILPEIGETGQSLLLQAKVLVIGAGGLGCPVLQYLGAAGVGTIGIIDHDVVEISNLQRQILFKQEDVGKPKAFVAQAALKAQNPDIAVIAYQEVLNPENAQATIQNFDLVIDGTDNFATRYLVNDTCVLLGKPFIAASILQFEGQIAVYNYQDGPTYRCLFPTPPQNALTCAEAGVLGVIGGIMGSLQANEAIKMITGIGEVLAGKLFVINALTLQNYTLSFERSPDWDKINPSFYANFCVGGVQNIEITAIQLQEHFDHYTIIDIRKPEELKRYTIGGLNISPENVMAQVGLIPLEKDIIICCNNGNTSLKLVQELISTYKLHNVYSLKGGINTYMHL